MSTLITVAGPTAVGKTALAIRLAEKYHTVIVSADSRQIYREASIGTAKPSPDELAAIPHFFIDSHSIHDMFTAGDYEREALALLSDLFKTHQTIILAGGSGLYIDAVCRGLDELPKPEPGVREKLNQRFRDHGIGPLQQQLKEVDPVYYQEADLSNPQRVIRALEVFESSGKPFSGFRKQGQSLRPFRIINIGLHTERSILYNRINQRVDRMMDQGLLSEARALYPLKQLPALRTVGYSELFRYMDGELSLETAVSLIKQNTRRYAKRQITWFKKDQDREWFNADDYTGITAYLDKLIHTP